MRMTFISPIRVAVILCACALASGQAHCSGTSHTGRPSAIVLSIDGTVYVAETEAAPQTSLIPKPKTPYPLYAGQVILCKNGGSAVIRIGGINKTIYSSDKPYRIPPVALTEVEKQELEALELYGKIGGSRGGDDVWSPAKDSYVRPQTATVEWHAFPGQLSFHLVSNAGAVLWSASKVDALRGYLTDTDRIAFQKALLVAQSEDKQSEVTLKTFPNDSGGYSFRVLPRKVASALDAALAKIALDEPEPVLRHLAEASVLFTHQYYVDAGTEFDLAASQAPDNTLVLAGDLAIQEKIGNLDGASKLRNKLTNLCKATTEQDTRECDRFRKDPPKPNTDARKISRSCDPSH